MKPGWYKEAYHRNVVDMHISDDLPEFMTQFDAGHYVDMLKLARAESAVVYAHSHVGYAYYPTRYGQMHRNLKGRDILKEVIEKCHENNINAIVYFSLIFDTWAYDRNPDWRIVRSEGSDWAKNARYGVCCPNAEGYRSYVADMARELCENYDFEGIRFDMTFWPGLCYCRHCRERYAREIGGDIPVIVNWFDKKWTAFQRCRERWLNEFAAFVTNTVKSVKPGVSVEHQASTFNANFGYGVSADLRDNNDFLQGDFYGGYIQGSMACKLFYNLTPDLPFGFETCSNEYLHDHTTLKKESMLAAKTFMAIANGGAFIFIDGIDPVGTLNPNVYQTMSRIFARTQKYEKYVGGKLVQDVAIYLSTESKCDFADNGKQVSQVRNSTDSAHVDCVTRSARAFIKNHIPFGVITRKNLGELENYKIIVLPNLLMMSKAEVDAIRDYVAKGGCIYASKYTSLVDIEGDFKDNFMLADVFGVSYDGITDESFTYIAPEGKGRDIMPVHINEKYPLSIYGSQIRLKPEGTAEVLATLVLPYTNPRIPRPFSSIHSNPPGISTGLPAVTINRYGRGRALYCSGDMENVEFHDEIFASFITWLLDGGISVKGDIPRQVEVTVFNQEGGRTILNFLSFQPEMPGLPVPAFSVRLKAGERGVRQVLHLPEEKKVGFKKAQGYVDFTVEGFDTFTMYAVDFES